MAGLIRLDTGEPHLCLAEFTKRTADDPLLGKCLIFPHATPFEWLAWKYTQTESFNKKEPASGLARLLSTNRGNRPRLFMRVINNCASKFTLPFEFDRNVAARFHHGTGNYVNAMSSQAQLEFLYDNFGHKDYVGSEGDPYRVSLTGRTLRGALAWKF